MNAVQVQTYFWLTLHIILSHWTKKTCCLYTISRALFLKWSHKALNHILLCLLLELYLVTQSACIGIPFQLAVKHMPDCLYAFTAWTVKVAVLCSQIQDGSMDFCLYADLDLEKLYAKG